MDYNTNKKESWEKEVTCPIHNFIKYKIWYKKDGIMSAYGGGCCPICTKKTL